MTTINAKYRLRHYHYHNRRWQYTYPTTPDDDNYAKMAALLGAGPGIIEARLPGGGWCFYSDCRGIRGYLPVAY